VHHLKDCGSADGTGYISGSLSTRGMARPAVADGRLA